jgi:hypothetical protein
MKRSAFLLLIFFSFALRSQTSVYHPLPSDSIVWLQATPINFGTFNFFIDKAIGDTVIGSHTYKKVYRSNYWSGSPAYPSSVSFTYSVAVREDVAAKKIYSVPATSGIENLLYDFDLQVGDTIQFSVYDTVWVASIDSTLVGGVYHKLFSFGNTGHDLRGAWIEGIGSSEGLHNNYVDMYYGLGAGLLCFSHDGVKLYGGNGTSCPLTVGIHELVNGRLNLNVSPNPTPGIMSLTMSCNSMYTTRIINGSGETVLCVQNNILNNLSLDLSAFPNGIYFVVLEDDAGNRASKKIIKQ